MKCAIMQPTYLPWSGYFNLMDSVDVFVFLDDVQYERRSWQSRNRILLSGAEHLLTVPTLKADRSETIRKIRIDNTGCWQRRHLQTLRHCYQAAQFGHDVLLVLQALYEREPAVFLSEFTQTMAKHIASMLGIATRFVRASDLACGGKRSEHLAEICKAVRCSRYLAPIGSRGYLEADRFSDQFGIEVEYQVFHPQPYKQLKTDCFVSHLSIVDVLAHVGPHQTIEYVRTGSVGA